MTQQVPADPGRRRFLSLTAGALSALSAGGRATAQVPFAGAAAGDARIIEDIGFRWCPPGRFMMGSPDSEARRRADEGQVPVTLTRGFWMARFETTQGDWQRIIGAFPDRLPSPQFGEGSTVPVYWVNFIEAEQFCAALTARARRSGTLPMGWEVRLPTEAQWEYACRAGATTAFAFGESLTPARANILGDPLPATPNGTGVGRATAVGRYPRNDWGICDMHGNVFEWCRDWYHATLPGGINPDLSNTLGVRNGDGTFSRVRRGGAWNDPEGYCRSAMRLRYEPHRRSDHIGFRVAVVAI